MLFCGGPLVLVAINTATYAPSAAASDARSDDEGDASEHRPRREAPCDEAERRPTRARSDPRLRGSVIGLPPRRRHLDRGTAPVALTAARPEGWRACVSPLMRAHVSGPPADVAVFMATSTKPRASPGLARRGESIPAPLPAGRLRL